MQTQTECRIIIQADSLPFQATLITSLFIGNDEQHTWTRKVTAQNGEELFDKLKQEFAAAITNAWARAYLRKLEVESYETVS